MIRVLKEGPAGTDAAAEDARLLACYTSGADPEAFRRLHDRYAGLVYRVCRRGAGADAADDAYQAVWLIFARRARTVRDGRVLPGWLARVAYRVSARARRRAAAATVGSDGLHPGGAAMAAAADPNPTADPAVGAAARELVGVIERAVAGLPDHLREVVELC
ncbi:MAG: hypothetical protein K2X82_27940, partial [Gemmataceae bacterium]|nr:hypothetical protein [Gemmataceae bacterium]